MALAQAARDQLGVDFRNDPMNRAFNDEGDPDTGEGKHLRDRLMNERELP